MATTSASDTRIAAAVAAARPGCLVTFELERSAVAGAKGRTTSDSTDASGWITTGATRTRPDECRDCTEPDQ